MSHRSIDIVDFNTDVIETSHRDYVLVDFWADWCAPCAALTRTLEDLVDESRTSFVLAKFDVSHDRESAAKLGVDGLPAVQLYHNGQILDAFSGALPRRTIRDFLDRNMRGSCESCG